ncbi:MAG: dTDP-4-dehydrorhamnose reductase [Armatimonadetes bacterium]|nr:dTDP-4-dehydrorhamnose reductase [Armatimonadota bacterium]
MRVLVTGGSGLLGSDLVAELRSRGHEVLAPGHRELDVTSGYHLEQLRKDQFQRLDWIINCAAYTAVDKAESERMAAMKLNAVAPGALGAVAQVIGARLITISTDFVFDGEAQTPYTESSPTHPIGVYGQSKQMGEVNALRENLGAIVVRTSWLYGAHGHCFPKTMIRAFEAGKSLRVVSDQVGKPTCTVDLARVLVDIAALKPNPGIYHAAGPESMSWHDFARFTLETYITTHALNQEIDLTPVATSEYPTPAKRPAYSVLSTTKIERLGIAPMRPVSESLIEFCARVGRLTS